MPNKLISTQPLEGMWNGNRIIFFQCQWRQDYSDRCGNDASHLVTQIGELTGREFTLRLCARHAKPFLDEMVEKDG